ncbi:MAG: DNA-binding domain-containing protein, partial [Betaproteobacteria bacterium]
CVAPRESRMLRNVQSTFADSLMAGDTLAAEHIRGPGASGGKLDGARRLEVYRHNVFTNLRNVLGDIFPVVKRIVGDAFFIHAADQFIRMTPSRSGDLNRYGEAWPQFLASYPHAAELPYLPDVANLEWAWHECFHAAEAASLDLGRLADVAEGEQGELLFRLHPAVRLLCSESPVLRIWQVNQEDNAGEMDIDWDDAGDHLVVRRDDAASVDVVIQALAPPAFAFLDELARHSTLEAAASAALAHDPEFDLQGFLIESVQSGMIVDFSRGA